jgi:hypothetical protein
VSRLLARLLGRARAQTTKRAAGSGKRSADDERRDAGPRIDAARQRLKQTIPPPEDPAP